MKKFLMLMLSLALCVPALANEPLIIREQGVFSAGGTVTEPLPGEFNVAENWLDFSRAGNTAHVDHANVFYQIPDGESKTPMVFLHGYDRAERVGNTLPTGARAGAISSCARGTVSSSSISHGAAQQVQPPTRAIMMSLSRGRL